MAKRGRPRKIPNGGERSPLEAIFGWFPDEGCKEATYSLGRQSKCEQCPFPRCLDDLQWKRGMKKKYLDLMKEALVIWGSQKKATK